MSMSTKVSINHSGRWYQIRDSTILEWAFFLAVFLYPFIIISHALYLPPQALLIAWGIFRMVRDRTPIARIDAAIAVALIGTNVVPLIVEASSDLADYSQISKMLVNGLFVMVIGKSGLIRLGPSSLRYFRFCAILWGGIILTLYLTSSGGPKNALLGLVGDDLTSEKLYQVADPLSTLFLTKNITAMYFVAVMALYCFTCSINGLKPRLIDLTLLLLVITSCFSRQAILGSIAVISLEYYIRNISSFKAYLLATVAVLLALLFFLFFFNLSSSGDGANQRLELWQDFFVQVPSFWLTGLGFAGLSEDLITRIGIDNYHMFFMNQIATYGITHMLCLNAAVILALCMRGKLRLDCLLLIFAYYFNILFQTFGYEFQNLLLIAVGYSYMTLRCRQEDAIQEHEATPNLPPALAG
jgi:hypothetical protein